MFKPTSQQWDDVRSRVIGYSDAVLLATKEAIGDELGVMDVDAVLCDCFNLEPCAECGHWFDKRDCAHYNGRGGFECASCASDSD